MYVKNIKLKNFRNYIDKEYDFSKNTNLIVGANAKGKTNLVEAIYVCSFGKSFRSIKDRELINFDKDMSGIDISFIKDDEIENIKFIINKNGKKYIKINDKNINKLSEIMEKIYTVIFSPEDLKIVKEEPAKRRNFIDRELSQIKISYFDNLKNYKKTLLQRNMYLKQEKIDQNILDIWDESLAKYGSKIIYDRNIFIKKLEKISKKIHLGITNDSEEIILKYIADIEVKEDLYAIEMEFLSQLKKSRKNDLFRRITNRGPHKDDLDVIINGMNARKFCSQGQQRTAALSLKLAEIEIIKQEKNENPILILDDVMSELDISRQKYLIKTLKDIQIFITTTEISEDIKNNLENLNIIEI